MFTIDKSAKDGSLQRLRERCPRPMWLNPEPQRIWRAPSVRWVH